MGVAETDDQRRIDARNSALSRLNRLTAWIGMGSVAAAAALAAIAAATVPGQATQPAAGSDASPSAAQASPQPGQVSLRHHRDSAGIAAAPGPGMVVSGGSR
jgi:hypothetical protein